jgi:hypothetical protein
MHMLTSTDAAAARQFSVSLRDAVDIAQVDLFMDRLVATLSHYERQGKLLQGGITAEELTSLEFESSSGQGYSRSSVEHIRQSAIESLRFYEVSISGGSAFKRPHTKVNRVKQVAPHVSLSRRDSSHAAVSSAASSRRAAQPYDTPANDFRPPATATRAAGSTIEALGFEVPVLEDTISAPIRRPEAVEVQVSRQEEPALFTSEIAQVLYEGAAPSTNEVYSAPLAPNTYHGFGAQTTPMTSPAPVQAPTVQRSQASPASASSAPSPVRTSQTRPVSAPATDNGPVPQAAPTGQPVGYQGSTAQTVSSSTAPARSVPMRVASQQVQRSAPQTQAPQVPSAGATSPQVRPSQTPVRSARSAPGSESGEPATLDVNEVLELLTNAVATKKALAQRSPSTHSAGGTIRVNTRSGPLEITAVRLHSNGQVYFETRDA